MLRFLITKFTTNRRYGQSLICTIVLIVAIFGVAQLSKYIVTEDEDVLSVAEEDGIEYVDKDILAINYGQLDDRVYRLSNNNIIDEIERYLAGHAYYDSNEIIDKTYTKGVRINYVLDNRISQLSKNQQEQCSIINAGVLFTLFSDIDVVDINIAKQGVSNRYMVYRPDFEDYMQNYNKEWYVKNVVEHFEDINNASEYWSSVHPYDSIYGDEIADFFRWYFTADTLALQHTDVYPYVDETVDAFTGRMKYNMLIQGLNYDNPLMNYYSAYRLVELYNDDYDEDIMLELQSCINNTTSDKVKAACEFTLTKFRSKSRGDSDTSVFTRFSETDIGGGKIAYSIKNNKLQEFARLEGFNDDAAFKLCKLSPNENMVLLKVVSNDSNYYYVVDTEITEAYIVKPEGVYSEGKKVSGELISRINQHKQANNHSTISNLANIRVEWIYGNTLTMTLPTLDVYVYNNTNNQDVLMSKQEWLSSFNTSKFIEEMQSQADRLVNEGTLDLENNLSRTTIEYDKEDVIIYNTSDIAKIDETMQISKSFIGGNITVLYDGDNPHIIQGINKALKLQS